jgi:hypothetical protein
LVGRSDVEAIWKAVGVVRKIVLKQILDKDNRKSIDWIILGLDRIRRKVL